VSTEPVQAVRHAEAGRQQRQELDDDLCLRDGACANTASCISTIQCCLCAAGEQAALQYYAAQVVNPIGVSPWSSRFQ